MGKIIEVPTFETNWRPLCWHMSASAPGVARAHVVVFAAVETIGHDTDIMNDLIYNIGKFAGTVDNTYLVKRPANVDGLNRFIQSNWPNA